MFGKVVQLLGIPMSDNFEIIYGIEGVNYKEKLFHDLPFGKVTFANMNPHVTKKHIQAKGYHITEMGGGFKEILIFNGPLAQKYKEEFLLVIIPYASKIRTKAKRLAGRYPSEGIYKMYAGDIIEITKSSTGAVHTYIAAQGGNEIFLVEKMRD